MKKKRTIRIILFLLIVTVLFALISSVLRVTDDTHTRAEFDSFYDMPQDSIDAVWLGASAVQSLLIPSEAYAHSGVTMYGLATASQPFALTKYLIWECDKTQSPQVYFVDIRMLAYDADVMGNPILNEGYIRRVTDSMRFSCNRVRAINDITTRLRKSSGEEINLFDFYFSFTTYHSRWDSLTPADFGNDQDAYLGYYVYTEAERFDRQETLSYLDAEAQPVSAANQEYLADFLDFCDEYSGKIVFTCTPNNLGEEQFGNYEYLKRIIEQRGYQVLDMNQKIDQIGLDYEKDFNDNMHVNVYGAKKVTDYMANYVKEQYPKLAENQKEADAIYKKTQRRLQEDCKQQKLEITFE